MKRQKKATPTGERTKAQILVAAIREFAQHGLAGGRVSRIARKAKVNNQAIYYYFKNKDELFKAALVFGYKTHLQMADIDWANDPRSPKELMRFLLEYFFDLIADNKDHIALTADENRNWGRHLRPDVLNEIRACTNASFEAFRAVLERGKAAKEFRQDIDPQDFFLFVVGHIVFYLNHRFTLSGIYALDTMSSKHFKRSKNVFSSFVLNALRP